MTRSPDIDDVTDVVERAGRVLEETLDGLRGGLAAACGSVEAESKPDGTPITNADLETDERLTSAISAAFPGHGILSEERATAAPEGAWTWVIDPIDGTSNFISGLPWWCVSVALTHAGSPVLAMVDAPALGARWTATRGGGAYRDGRRLHVRGPVDWGDPRQRHIPLMLTTGSARRARTAGIRLNPRVMGSTALDMCTVAEGVAAGSLAMVPHVWDIAAAALLVTEAAGTVTTLRGEPLLPLKGGEEHAERSAVTAAGPDESSIQQIATHLLP